MVSTSTTRVGVCLAAATFAASCAAHRPSSLTGRLVRQGEPSINLGEPLKAPAESLETYMSKIRHLAASAKPAPKQALGVSVESRDPQLSAALLAAAMLPTAENHRAVAAAYYRLGILDAAHARLNAAVQLDPADAAAFDGLARIWRDWGFPHLALGDAHRAVYYAPSSPTAHNTLGTVLQALGRRQEARTAYEAALRLDPRAFYALNNLCYLAFVEGDHVSAGAACRRALDLDPLFTTARNNLGLVYAATGRFDRAAQEFSSSGDVAASRYNMGILYLAKREFRKAVRAFEEAQALRPALTAARERARQARELATRSGEPGQ